VFSLPVSKRLKGFHAVTKAAMEAPMSIHGPNHDASRRAAEIDTEFVDFARVELGRSGKRRNERAVERLMRTDDEADAA
jgi:hypothetical protein